MKNFYKPLFPIAGFVLLAATVLRGDEPSAPLAPPDRREHREEMRGNLKEMAKELNLTADQKIQIEAIHKQTADSVKAMRSDTSLTEDQKRAKGRELRKASEDQVNALLTPEQQAKAKELRAKHGRRGPGGERPPGDRPPEDKP